MLVTMKGVEENCNNERGRGEMGGAKEEMGGIGYGSDEEIHHNQRDPHHTGSEKVRDGGNSNSKSNLFF